MARILISMKDTFLKSIDEMAQREQRTRSWFKNQSKYGKTSPKIKGDFFLPNKPLQGGKNSWKLRILFLRLFQ